ncbi:NAD(P)H-dependent oxidoreductase [Sinorhizobium meliloti]|uniref:NADPH-dependent FMN reductase n=1 Tax=Rhizobium meliloti TaxID=382 RepID=UPI003F14078D
MNHNRITGTERPFIVGIGGTFSPNSSTERALKAALSAAAAKGAETVFFGGDCIDFPIFTMDPKNNTEKVIRYIEAIKKADGIIVASPGYHGAVSGMVKNALDYVELLSKDERPYFDHRAVGCIATGAGWQGAIATLTGLRSIVHALRGWPTPIGVSINTSDKPDAPGPSGFSQRAEELLTAMASQVVDFALAKKGQQAVCNGCLQLEAVQKF